MSSNDEINKDMTNPLVPGSTGREILKQSIKISGAQTLNMILDQENPVQVVQEMSRVDLFWLVKKVGEDDSFSLLRMASDDQWHYIMDMELWERDHFDIDAAMDTVVDIDDTVPASHADGEILMSEGDTVTNALFADAGDLVVCKLSRDVSDDNVDVDVKVLAVKIEWSKDQDTD